MAKRNAGLIRAGMVMAVIAIVALSFYYHCLSGSSKAKTFLEEQGYTEVSVSMGGLFACSKNERSTSFTAKDPVGKTVSGSVCNPVFLNPAIRLD